MTEVQHPVVLDNGTSSIKAGFAGDDAPKFVFPTTLSSSKTGDNWVGYQAQLHRDVAKVRNPISGGVIQNFDDMEKIWSYTFSEQLKIDPSERAVLMTEAPFNPTRNREKMVEIMFEKYRVTGFHAALQAAMSLMAAGQESGLVLESGDSVTHAIPIVEGAPIAPAIMRFEVAGADVTEFFIRLLTERGYYFTSAREKQVAIDMKESLAYVALNFQEELALATSSSNLVKKYSLPDGRVLEVNAERFICGESFFTPGFLGVEFEGLHKAVFKSVNKCPLDVRKTIFNNIVLAGGNTMFLGFGDRLHKELLGLVPNGVKVNVQQRAERKYMNWLGGSIFASLDSFPSTCVTRAEYSEKGSSVIHKKCYNAMLI